MLQNCRRRGWLLDGGKLTLNARIVFDEVGDAGTRGGARHKAGRPMRERLGRGGVAEGARAETEGVTKGREERRPALGRNLLQRRHLLHERRRLHERRCLLHQRRRLLH